MRQYPSEFFFAGKTPKFPFCKLINRKGDRFQSFPDDNVLEILLDLIFWGIRLCDANES
jgi:hypothetical protein